MKLLVFGASGATGQRIVAEAERRGHEVVAFTRGESGAQTPTQHVTRGDVTSARDVDAAIAAGCDVVISALGARSLKKTRLLETP